LSGRTQSHPEHCSSTATAVIGQKSPDVIQLTNTSSLSGGGGDGGKSPPTVSTSLVRNTKRKPFLPKVVLPWSLKTIVRMNLLQYSQHPLKERAEASEA